MIALSLDELAALELGNLRSSPWASEVTGVQIDSRRIAEGDLFVAIGRGSDFVAHALARGAAAALVPADPFAAMAALGRTVRERSRATVVGITGSTGKTSTKEILAALCRPHRRVVAAEASYNNELGVPLTLCRLEGDTEICVLELAMRGFGQIADLCAIANPSIGVITNIFPVHLELVGSLEGVARAKAELVAALPADGTGVVPTDAPALEPFLGRSDVELVRFGPGGDVTLEDFTVTGAVSRISARVDGEAVELDLSFTARHQAANVLAALAAYRALGLPLSGVGRGAADVRLPRWRGEELPLPADGLLINDSYNANPASMRAALEHLRDRAGQRRQVAVLGDMAELGADGPAYHREIGRAAAVLGVEALVAVGTLARGYVEGASAAGVASCLWAPSVNEAIRLAHEVVRPGDCVLVKGSRAMGLEAVADALAAAGAAVATSLVG